MTRFCWEVCVSLKATGKQKICDALCRLAAERPAEKVPISDLIEEAGVNRSTFYYHFDNPRSVLDYMIKNFCQKYLQLLSMPSGQTAQALDSDSQMQLEQNVCTYVFSVQHYIRFFLSEHNYLTFKQGFLTYFRDYCKSHRVVQIFSDGSVCPLKQGIVYDYFLRILASQLLGILEFWTERDFSEGPEDFIQLFNALHNSTISLQG